MTETSKGLPVVGQTTVDALWQNYTTRESWGDNLDDTKERLYDENPELAGFIESQIGKFPSEMHRHMLEIVVGALAVLECQAEANKLAAQFGTEI